MTQLFGYPIVEKECDELAKVELITFGSLDDYIIYRVSDEDYHGNHEIYVCKTRNPPMWIVNKATNSIYQFNTVNIEMARALREKFDKLNNV